MKNRIPPQRDMYNLNRPANAFLTVDPFGFIVFWWRQLNGRYIVERWHVDTCRRVGWWSTAERPEDMPMFEAPRG